MLKPFVGTHMCALLQALVEKFDDMVTALSTLANQAAAKFDQQKIAAQSLSAAMRDSITAMQDAAALAQQLQSKYVQQSLLLDAATGSLVEDWNCSRTQDWEVSFATSR